MIEIKNVTKSYEMGDENVLALDGVNLTVEAVSRRCSSPWGGC